MTPIQADRAVDEIACTKRRERKLIVQVCGHAGSTCLQIKAGCM
jgi:hypothetical protein